MKSVCGDMKLICLKREPPARSLSNYKHAQRRLAETGAWEKLLTPISLTQFLIINLMAVQFCIISPLAGTRFSFHVFGGFLAKKTSYVCNLKFLFWQLGRAREAHGVPRPAARSLSKAGENHRNAGGDWTFVCEENVDVTVDGQVIQAERFAAVGN